MKEMQKRGRVAAAKTIGLALLKSALPRSLLKEKKASADRAASIQIEFGFDLFPRGAGFPGVALHGGLTVYNVLHNVLHEIDYDT
ncbi:MAG: hypothetical protein HC901_00600 [Bdellovibrionaceae bacterium]|nr:hypothetical protein [Pseudobdellovibrionaceae bacterium]